MGVVVLAATVQIGSWGLFHDGAVGPAFPRLVPYAAGVAVTRRIADLPGFHSLRTTLATAALRHHDTATASALIAELPPGAARDELAGQEREARGDRAGALRSYLAAGDVEKINAEVERLDRGDVAAALRLQMQLVAQLRTDVPISEHYAEALYRLGKLESERAYRIPAEEPVAARRSLVDFQAALVQRPISEMYLLNAGNAALRLGELTLAETYFRRAADVNPHSAAAHAALGAVALQRGDRPGAVRELQTATQLDPHDVDMQRFRRKLEGAR